MRAEWRRGRGAAQPQHEFAARHFRALPVLRIAVKNNPSKRASRANRARSHWVRSGVAVCMAPSLCARRTAGWPFSDGTATGAGFAALVWRLAAVADRAQ